MMKRIVFPFLFVLLLLAGQQIALVHSVWHLGNHFPTRALGDTVRAAKDAQNDGQSSQLRLCDLHSALGNVLAGDCGSMPAMVAATIPHDLTSHATAWHVAHPADTPPSRAPPVLL